MLRGGTKHKFLSFGYNFCDPVSWVILVIYLVLTYVLVTFAFARTLDEQDIVIRNGHPRPFTWTREGFHRFSIIIFITGMLSGALGIAGALLIGPILIQMKMDPRISSATSNFMGMWLALAVGLQ